MTLTMAGGPTSSVPWWSPASSHSSGSRYIYIADGLHTPDSWFGLTAVSRGDVSMLDTAAHAPNPQVMLNIATMYACKDLTGLLINRRLAKTTLIHHLCVFMAYLYVLR